MPKRKFLLALGIKPYNMKKSIFIALICLGSLTVKAQQADSTKSTKPHEQYCMIIATGKLFSTKVSISIDYGQHTTFFGDKGAVRDENGNLKDFNSVIDALNYMASQGWLFVNAYALSEGSNGPKVLNYVMRKPVIN